MNSFNVSLCYPEQHHPGRLKIEPNELIFTFSTGTEIKIAYIDHMCMYREDMFKFAVKKERYILNIITKQLKRFNFLFDEKTDCNTCVSIIQKNFTNCKRMSLEYEDKFEFLENADFVDINKPSFWRVSSLNSNYIICETLPENVVVVDGVSDQSLIESKKCHNNSRFPIISYISSINKSCILTSSSVTTNVAINQPTRCHVDEAMIAHLSKDVSDKNVYIVQFTTISNLAMVQQTTNKEKPHASLTVSGTSLLNSWITWTNYNTYTINVLPISQLSLCLGHILTSLNTLPSKYYMPNALFGLTTENSSHLWLNTIYMCISRASMFANQMVKNQTIVYLMDESGVDYTAVVSCMCQIMIEPMCRTVDGLLALVYREWFCSGHPFDSRHANILPDNNSRTSVSANTFTNLFEIASPVFFLFLNCVKMIQQKYVRFFEFNENLLLHLFQYSYECVLGNNEKSRKANSINIKRSQLWNYDKNCVSNPLYDRYNGAIVNKFWPHEMELWDSVFLKPNKPTENSSFSETLIEKIQQLILDAGCN